MSGKRRAAWAALRAADQAGAAWLEEQLVTAAPDPDPIAVGVGLARAGRRFRRETVAGPGARPWTCVDLGRWLWTAAALDRRPGTAGADLLQAVYRRGSLQEQASVLRMLAWLPASDRFVDLAVHACRTSTDDVFAAIACDNPYPAACFPDESFRQMVLKTIFVGLSTERIEGWEARADAELGRMLRDFREERRAAGRTIPADIDRILQHIERSRSEGDA